MSKGILLVLPAPSGSGKGQKLRPNQPSGNEGTAGFLRFDRLVRRGLLPGTVPNDGLGMSSAGIDHLAGCSLPGSLNSPGGFLRFQGRFPRSRIDRFCRIVNPPMGDRFNLLVLFSFSLLPIVGLYRLLPVRFAASPGLLARYSLGLHGPSFCPATRKQEKGQQKDARKNNPISHRSPHLPQHLRRARMCSSAIVLFPSFESKNRQSRSRSMKRFSVKTAGHSVFRRI